jgi:hypothetical protein
MTLRGDEAAVVHAFVSWLQADGWQARTEVDWCDIMATRDGHTLLVEAKGRTSAPGLDVDTAFGQLLRRMGAEDDDSIRYGLVVRDEPKSVRAALRVPRQVLGRLRITVYAVDDHGQVRILGGE